MQQNVWAGCLQRKMKSVNAFILHTRKSNCGTRLGPAGVTRQTWLPGAAGPRPVCRIFSNTGPEHASTAGTVKPAARLPRMTRHARRRPFHFDQKDLWLQ
jgi:hypothetical protein